jgi:hypothetical protein
MVARDPTLIKPSLANGADIVTIFGVTARITATVSGCAGISLDVGFPIALNVLMF